MVETDKVSLDIKALAGGRVRHARPSHSGLLLANHSLMLTTARHGQVSSVLVSIGDTVKERQPIYELED